MYFRMLTSTFAIGLATLIVASPTSASAQTRRISPHLIKRTTDTVASQATSAAPLATDAALPAPELPSSVAKAMGLIGDGQTQLVQAMEPIGNLPSPGASPGGAASIADAVTPGVSNAINNAITGSGVGSNATGFSTVSPNVPGSHNAMPSMQMPPNMGAPAMNGSMGPMGCDSCGPTLGGNCGNYHGSGINFLPGLAIDHLSIFGGVQGYKNNSNRGADGSFGFHEGVNFGTSGRNIILPPSVGMQLGFQATQTNFNGASFTLQERNQTFVTAGIFRRGDYGLQGGIAFDYLWDDWYYDLNVGQIRGELSMAISDRTSYGFMFATPLDEETVVGRIFGNDVTETWETADTYAIFIRSNWLAAGRGEGKLFAGLTGDSDGLLGAQSRLPLLNGFALETEFTYLIPDEGTGNGAIEEEAWNVGISLAWYPGSLACGACNRYHRPLFDVANNGSFILRRK